MIISSNSLAPLLLLPWAALWLAGGVWLSGAVFRLRPNEYLIVGIVVGWLTQNWLANLLAQVMPIPLAFWLAGGIVFLVGGGLALRSGWRALVQIPISLSQVFILGLLVYIYYSLSRGLAVFDDFQNLATISNLAAGDIPPHFVLDPKVVFGYHHFLQLVSAQMMRIGGIAPWVVVDAGRGLAFGSAVMLGALWTQRLTRSTLAGLVGGAMVAFGSGARWLLLLIPHSALAWISKSVVMIGSGKGSGADLAEAMVSFWAVEGAGPVAYPFAFANGIFPAGVTLGNTSTGLTPFVIIFILLLTFNRWRSGWGAVLSAIFISIWGLLGEAELVTITAGWGILAVAYLLVNETRRLPRLMWTWLAVIAAGCVIGLLEGGAWTDLIFKIVARLAGQPVAASYQTIGFAFTMPPAVVSSHLGVLSILNPATLLVALLELGPVLLVLPLLIAWGIKAFRLGRWYEAATVATVLVGLLMVFVQFTGSTGVRNTPRLYVFMPLLAAFSVPLVWIWASHRSAAVKTAAAGIGLVTMLSGMMMFGISLLAIQRPVYSYFLGPLDARMAREHWNRLEPGAVIFDPTPYRAPTIFGRPTDSSLTWYQTKPEWNALVKAPDPAHLYAAGFRYAYIDNHYWDELDSLYQSALSGGCARLIDQVDDKIGNFRHLIDLGGCH